MKDLDAFGGSMPQEELVEEGGRIRRRAVFSVSDDEMMKKMIKNKVKMKRIMLIWI